MTTKTLSQWWKAAFLCFILAIPTAFVVNKEAGVVRLVSRLDLFSCGRHFVGGSHMDKLARLASIS
jgi:hypothetical protein